MFLWLSFVSLSMAVALLRLAAKRSGGLLTVCGKEGVKVFAGGHGFAIKHTVNHDRSLTVCCKGK